MRMNKRNYQKELDREIQKLEEGHVPSLLLHSCCAPCSSYVLEYLSEYFSITVFYYNPNIYPESEYRTRVQEQKRFIGNASHELQTPLAACSNRIEMLLDSPDLTEKQAGELVKVHGSLQDLIRLNRTLLLLTKIENGQFPNTSEINFRDLVTGSVEMFQEIYPGRNITVTTDIASPFVVEMNDQLALILVRNLVKNAFIHSRPGSVVSVCMDSSGFSVSNPGTSALDGTGIFSRFYHGQSSEEGSTGLGLAIVHSICKSYGMSVSYVFREESHVFTVKRNGRP